MQHHWLVQLRLEWQGTRPITARSCIKFDVTKHRIASDLWRQPPSFPVLLTHASFPVCHIYLLFLSALLIFTPSNNVIVVHCTGLTQRSGLRGCPPLKQVTSIKALLFPLLLQSNQGASVEFPHTRTKNADKKSLIQMIFSHFPTCAKESPDANTYGDQVLSLRATLKLQHSAGNLFKFFKKRNKLRGTAEESERRLNSDLL